MVLPRLLHQISLWNPYSRHWGLLYRYRWPRNHAQHAQGAPRLFCHYHNTIVIKFIVKNIGSLRVQHQVPHTAPGRTHSTWLMRNGSGSTSPHCPELPYSSGSQPCLCLCPRARAAHSSRQLIAAIWWTSTWSTTAQPHHLSPCRAPPRPFCWCTSTST